MIKLIVIVETLAGTFAISRSVWRVNKKHRLIFVRVHPNCVKSVLASEIDKLTEPGEPTNAADKSLRVPARSDSPAVLSCLH